MVDLSVIGQPYSARQQQLEKKMVRRTRKRRLEAWKANRPIATNCEEKQESALFHKNETEGGCFSSEKKAGNFFPAGFVSHCSLAEPAIYIISNHQWPNSSSLVHMVRVSFSCPGASRRNNRRSWPLETQFVFKGQRSTKPFLKYFFSVYIVYNSAIITYAKITGAINLHFIGAHFRFFHSVSRDELAIQLCIGQRRVWYASWIPHKKKISHSEKNWAVSFTIVVTLFVQVSDCRVPQDRQFLSLWYGNHFSFSCKENLFSQEGLYT